MGSENKIRRNLDYRAYILRLVLLFGFISLLAGVCYATLGDQELAVSGAKFIWNANSQTFSIAGSGSMSETVDYTWMPDGGDPNSVIITKLGTGILEWGPGGDVNQVFVTNPDPNWIDPNGLWFNFTEGSVIFADANGQLTEDNSNFFFDDAQDFLGVRTLTPNAGIQVVGWINFEPDLFNTQLGEDAGNSITTGPNNVLIGYRAGFTLTTISDVIMIGKDAGLGTQAANPTQGSGSIAIGSKAMFADIGDKNIAIGFEAARWNQSDSTEGQGDNNISIGYQAYKGTDGTSVASRNISIGTQAAFVLSTGDDNQIIGNKAGFDLTTGKRNVAIGTESGFNITSGNDNILLGHSAGFSITEGFSNVAIGQDALKLLTTSDKNTAVGIDALEVTTGEENVGVGWHSGLNNTSGNRNVFVGAEAGRFNTTGDDNVYVGDDAVGSGVTGDQNRNTVIGSDAGFYLIAGGDDNIIVGYKAGFGALNDSTGINNVIIGNNAMGNNVWTSASSNVVIGYNAGLRVTTANNSVYIGNEAGSYQTTDPNRLFIDARDRGSAANDLTKSLIWGLFDDDPANQTLTINADVTLNALTVTDIADTQIVYSNATVLAGDSTFTFNDTTKVVTITGIADGGRTNYDLKVGDTSTPDYGIVQIGDTIFGRTSYISANGQINLDGAVLTQNNGGPVTSEIEFIWAESTGATCRLALPKSGVGNATYNPRSMLMAGPAPADTNFVTVGYWQTNNSIFDNLACDTVGSGADLGVQGSVEIEVSLFVDSIIESTSGGGITFQPLADSTTAFQFLDADGGTPILNIDSTNERVGVKVVSPTKELDVRGQALIRENGTGLREALIISNTQTAGLNVGVVLKLEGAGANSMGSFVAAWEGAATTDSFFAFRTRENNSIVEQMRLTSTGFLGVGETAPETLLELTGTTPVVITGHPNTHSDADESGLFEITGKREDGAGTETESGHVKMWHDGAGVNDQLTKMTFGINSGAGVIDVLEVDSNADWTITAKTNTDLKQNWAATTNSGLITWMEDEDYFDFADTVKTSAGRIINRTSVTSTPYTVLASDEHISVTTASVAITLNLPAIIDGTIYHFKDQDENSAGNNITLSPNGAETIENFASLTINTNGGSVTLVGNSTTSNWEIQ